MRSADHTAYLILLPAAPAHGVAGGHHRLEVLKDALNLGGEKIEVSASLIIGIEGVEAETFPPSAGIGMLGTDDHRATGGLGIQLNSGCEHVRNQCGAHALPVVATIDS